MSLQIKYSLFFFLSLLVFLGLPQMGGSSEAREAHIASVIIRESEWILPTRNGLIPSKPPLFHWITAGFDKISFDIPDNDFIARLPSAIFAAFSLLLTLLICSHLVSQVPKYHNLLSPALNYCALILISTYGFTSMAQRSMVDMTFSFFTLFASYFLIRKIQALNDSKLEITLGNFDLTMFFLCGALAVLSKGPLGLVLPLINLLVISAHTSFRTTIGRLIRPHFSWILFLLIVLPWYLLAIRHAGNAFIDRQLMLENIDRFMGAETAKPFWFYLPTLITQALPWSLIGICFFINKVKPQFFKKFRLSNQPLFQLPLYIFLAGFIFFSISGGKRASYLLPLYPFLAVWLSLQLISSYDNIKQVFSQITKILPLLNLLLWIFIALTYLSSWYFSEDYNFFKVASLAWQGYLIPVIILTIFSLYYYINNCQSPIYFSCLLFLAFLAVTQSAAAFKWQIKSYRETAASINNSISSIKKIGVIKTAKDEYFDSMLYYLNRPVKLLEPDNVNSNGLDYLIAKQTYVTENPELFKDLPEPKYLLSEFNYLNKTLKEDMLLFRIRD